MLVGLGLSKRKSARHWLDDRSVPHKDTQSPQIRRESGVATGKSKFSVFPRGQTERTTSTAWHFIDASLSPYSFDVVLGVSTVFPIVVSITIDSGLQVAH